MLSLLFAQDSHGRLAHVPQDAYESLTLGKWVCFGRRAWEAHPRPLEGRYTVVFSHRPHSKRLNQHRQTPDSVFVWADDFSTMVASAANYRPEVIVAGGLELFKQSISRATRLYVFSVPEATGPIFNWKRSAWKTQRCAENQLILEPV